ncbi:MAG TPA: hypothetical protein VGN60_11370 [Devosia sp.]|jgi:hypothetical protein|nr:hypothetical protein [Devosia sp.]
MRRLLVGLTLAGLLSAGVAVAQTNMTASNIESQGQGEGGPQGQIASVGAGTSNGVTTGVSGPDQGGGLEPGELPPLPSADLCTDYVDQPAYAYCLALVLAEEGDEGL